MVLNSLKNFYDIILIQSVNLNYMELNLTLKRFISGVLIASSLSFANTLNYSLIKKESSNSFDKNNTLLVIGGIQGDEPGGFLAASLLSTEYEIKQGSVWIVPNLNFPSIIKRSRGVNGDMNRKFSKIKKKDPDYSAVFGIKSLIKDSQVALIVNLHDGSGFYRKEYVNSSLNPKRWGNSCIIDQRDLKGVKYGELGDIASQVVDKINKHLLSKEHKYHVKNTKTKEGDLEMLKSLTFYAIEQKKAAYANEASKSLKVHERAYYHLIALEKYMDIMGIKYKRNFALTPQNVKNAINKGVEVSFFDKKIYLSLDNPRSIIRYVPLPKKKPIDYKASNPLVAVVKDGNSYNVHYGNRKLTELDPQYFEYAFDLQSVKVEIDNEVKSIPLGSLVKVGTFFKVLKNKNQRVNVIGYASKKNEADIKIKLKNILKRYSIDKKAKTFRVEIYDTTKNKKGTYAGMFLVEFESKK